ncbi:TetR family transcriptional regulator [Geotalea uraniireducens]|uniref:TetR family transcriptional regulator n=1 Tax=Geotalea uraniireducens TaxID=351604 RepID=A0ABN6VP98_9BACT|nr:TetR/AcrR family transcriptional regulator [Geotalea uraniireducens]BDV42124.1 TetR family transcriptional regulator [Geotalea uraniireducens]
MKGDEAVARERIVGRASEEFFSRGFARVSMDELARQLRMSKKTIYRYFPTKDDLIRAVFRAKTARIHQLFQETVASRADFADKLYRLWIAAGKELTELGQQFQADLRAFTPALARELETFRREEINRNFHLLIEHGIAEGALRRDINVEVLVQIYISAIMGVITPETLATLSVSIDQAFRTILDVIFDGILADGARPGFRTQLRDAAPRA